MKFLIALVGLFVSAQVHATTLTCKTQMGDVAYVNFGQNTAQVTISSFYGKSSPEMRYSSLCHTEYRPGYPNNRKTKCHSRSNDKKRSGLAFGGYDSNKRMVTITCNGI